MCLNFALAAVLFVTHLVLKSISAKKFYSETQKATVKHNRRLMRRLVAFGSIPIAVVIVLNIVLALIFFDGNKTIYKCDDFNTFKTHLQTLVVDVDEDLPAGEYYLAFPDEMPEYNTKVDLGNGFYGVYSAYYSGYWRVTYGKEPEYEIDEGYKSPPSWTLYVHKIDSTKFVVNARYYLEENVWDNFGNRLSLNADLLNGKHYVLAQNITDTLNKIAIYTITIVTICTIVTCVVIYVTKHKKQKYGF